MTYYTLFILAQAISPDTAAAIEQTAKNTSAYPWTVSAFIVACLSLGVAIPAAVFAYRSMVYAKKTLAAQEQTERNTYRLEPEVQKDLLIEMCRHLYRNLVCSYTIGEKMRLSQYLVYPSEEHLVKMKVNLEDIHDELFYKQEDEFFMISKLYVLLRNYNAELDIICDHFRDAKLDTETKRRDIKTLLVKCGLLTSNILDFIEKVWPGQSIAAVRQQIINEWRGAKDAEPQHRGGFIAYATRGTVYTDRLFPGAEAERFLAHFNEDVRIEMGRNEEGGERIHMIHFA